MERGEPFAKGLSPSVSRYSKLSMLDGNTNVTLENCGSFEGVDFSEVFGVINLHRHHWERLFILRRLLVLRAADANKAL